MIEQIKEKINKSIRILSVSKKPDEEEFSKIAKITGAGMVAIGLIGIIISLVFEYI